jgi:hypothetical protein
MEWATSIRLEDYRLKAEIQHANGEIEIVGLEVLGSRGLPKPAIDRRKSLLTDFTSWKAGEIKEYTNALALGEVPDDHQVFEFHEKGKRYLVPALALMRGLFRPHRDVLHAMFLPQGLERISSPIISESSCHAVPSDLWNVAGRRIVPSLLAPLAWMHAFPSANRMCSSVTEQALKGRIGLLLPNGTAKLVVRGVSQQETIYVTEITVIFIVVAEEPCEFARLQSRNVMFHESAIAAVNNGHERRTCDTNILLNADGTATLSDAEWKAIQPIIESRRATWIGRKYDSRLLLEGVLNKLATGVAWKAARYSAGNWINASNLLNKLKKSGQWKSVLEVLHANRAALDQ